MPRQSFLQTIVTLLLRLYRWLVNRLQSWIHRSTGQVITLDTGRRVCMGRQIAAGGFSIVFEAIDLEKTPTVYYALKRVQCPDAELLSACRHEASVHRAVRHASLMPLLGMTVVDHCCYMLFPYIPLSLRQEVNRRMLLHDPKPWSLTAALHMFYQLAQGVQALHQQARYSHRDIKVENVLLRRKHGGQFQPVLMDFGSAGPLIQQLDSRRTVLHCIEHAAQHTTMSYRPPELFDGGLRAGDDDLDYAKVDVWCLGCTLFAMLLGASPAECEFSRSTGQLRIVECTALSVLQPLPPRPPAHSPTSSWYDGAVYDLMAGWLQQDRRKRPGLTQVLEQVQKMLEKLGERVDPPATSSLAMSDQDDDHESDGIALMSSGV